jgi:hypothetical protein
MDNGNVSNINQYAFTIVIILGAFLLLVPRKYAAVPVLIVASYVTLGQVIAVASAHITLLRMIVFLGWIRIISKREIFNIKLISVDKALLSWAGISFAMHSILWNTPEAVINQFGFLCDTVGIYFLFRFIINDWSYVYILLRWLSVIIIPLAVAMVIENITGRNMFFFLGGVYDLSMVRDDVLRSQGTFAHPILAGTFGASLVPLFIAAFFTYKKSRFVFFCGIVSATAITLTSGSVGPLFAFICGVAAMASWVYRRYFGPIFSVVILGFVTLQLLLGEPIWHYLDNIGEMTGGTGDHRSELIDAAIKYFDEWWLFGARYTAHWMPRPLENFPDKADITNQYIAVGVDGGIFALFAFLMIIVCSYRCIYSMMKSLSGQYKEYTMIVWSFGAVLFVHLVSFISVCYFDQIVVFWYLLLAMTSSLFAHNLVSEPVSYHDTDIRKKDLGMNKLTIPGTDG